MINGIKIISLIQALTNCNFRDYLDFEHNLLISMGIIECDDFYKGSFGIFLKGKDWYKNFVQDRVLG